MLPGVEKIKVRSSANAEDVPDFDGAGLHDSYAADTTKHDLPDRPLPGRLDSATARSNGRSSRSRCGARSRASTPASGTSGRSRKDHLLELIRRAWRWGWRSCPAYDIESEVAANAVVVTRVLNTDDVYGYSLSVQEGNNLVTNPDPGTYSEVTIAGFISDDRANQPDDHPLREAHTGVAGANRTGPVTRSRCSILSISLSRVERAYCRAKRGYYRDCQFVTVDERQADVARPRAEDPRERAVGLQAGARVRRQLSLAVA